MIVVITIFCVSVFAEDVKVLMNDGKVYEGEFLGINDTTVFIKDKDGKVNEYPVVNVKEIFNAKTHKAIPLKPTGESEVLKEPEKTPPKPPKKEKKIINYEFLLEIGAPFENSIKKDLWPLYIIDHPTTPWSGMDQSFGFGFNVMFQPVKDWEVGLFMFGTLLGLGSENSGVDVTYYDSLIGYYTFRIEYDLPIRTSELGIKIKKTFYHETNANIDFYGFLAAGQFRVWSNFKRTVTSPLYSGYQSGSIIGETTFYKFGCGMNETKAKFFIEFGFQIAQVPKLKCYVKHDSFYPETEDTSYYIVDQSGKQIGADLNGIFLNIGYKFWWL